MAPLPSRTLSLGAMFRHLRGDLADRGAIRITLEFRMESRTTIGSGGGAQLFMRRGLRAQLDQVGSQLRRAHLVATGMSPRPLAEFLVVAREDRHLYTVDGSRYGRLLAPPRLFDLVAFESQLEAIAARDVIVDEDRQPEGSSVNVLRIDVDDLDMHRLVGVFGDGLEAMAEVLDGAGRSVVMTAGTDVGFHYRWLSTGEEAVASSDGLPERCVSRHSTRVSVRLEPLAAAVESDPGVSPELPGLRSIDEIWSLAREQRSPGPSAEGWSV